MKYDLKMLYTRIIIIFSNCRNQRRCYQNQKTKDYFNECICGLRPELLCWTERNKLKGVGKKESSENDKAVNNKEKSQRKPEANRKMKETKRGGKVKMCSSVYWLTAE